MTQVFRPDTPADGPYWLTRFADSIVRLFKQIFPVPLRLFRSTTADLPTAADYEGGLLYDTDTDSLKYSNAVTWIASQPSDATLTALAAYNTNGFLVQTAADTFAGRTLSAPAAGFTITNPAGTAGNPTFVLANDLAGVEGLSSTGIATRTASDTWTVRTITGTANEITATNGSGVSGNPTLSLPSALTFTGKTITGGTYSTITAAGIGAANSADAPLYIETTAAGALSGLFVNTLTPASNSGAGFTMATSITPTATGQRLGFFVFGSRNSGGTVGNACAIVGYATGAWTAGSSHPSRIDMEVTASASATRTVVLRIEPTGIDVTGLSRCDTFRIDQTPTAETPAATHTITISANGTNYKLLCVAA